ncbi:Ig-like domain-containing protein, partial [Halomonas sp. V046]|uniref:Ig-like domain-containing protein n=1 Tax=Halomonas sp. V046 TaxID=3459611 RepID=UPI0040445D50
GKDVTTASATAPVTLSGSYGTLTITGFDAASGQIAYTYTADGGAGDHSGSDPVLDSFTLVVTDYAGQTQSDDLVINLTDTGPAAVDDAATTAEDTPVTYNVLANDDGTSDDQGADGATLTAATLSATSAAAGAVSFDSAGNVTFTPTAGFEGDALINYTITDADGDPSTATLTVTVAADSAPTVTAASGSVSEAGLADGSAPASDSETASGTFDIATGNDSLATLRVGDVDVSQAGLAGIRVPGSYGTLTVTESGGTFRWSYTLDTSVDHSSDASVQDVFALVATDSDGDSDTANLTLVVTDDGPSVTVAGATSAMEGGAAITGTWVMAPGADGASATQAPTVEVGGSRFALGEAIDTGSGTLVVVSDGTWRFTPGLDTAASVGFAVVGTDGDGDEDKDTHSITLVDGAGPEAGGASGGDDDPSSAALDMTLRDADTRDGGVGTDSGKLAFTAGSDTLTTFRFGNADADGRVSGITVSGLAGDTEIVWRLQGEDLVGTIDGVDVLTLSLSAPADGIAPGASGDVGVQVTLADHLPHGRGADSLSISGIRVTAADGDGDSASGTVVVRVQDDAPVEFASTAVGNTGFLEAVGADGFGSLVFDSSLEGASVTDRSGNALYHQGAQIKYVLSDDGKTLSGMTDSGKTVFDVGLSGDGASYDVQVYGNIGVAGGESQAVNFSQSQVAGRVPGQGYRYRYFDDPDGENDVDFLASAWSLANGGQESFLNLLGRQIYAGNDSKIGNGEVVRYDFVNGLDTTGGRPTWDSHQGVTQFTQRLYEMDSVHRVIEFTLRVVKLSTGSGDVGGDHPYRLGGDTLTLTADNFSAGANANVTFNSDGTVRIRSVGRTSFTIDSESPFQAIEIRGHGSYVSKDDPQGFFLLADQSYVPGDIPAGEGTGLTLDVVGTDADGDSAAGVLDIDLGAPGQLHRGTVGDDVIDAGIGDDVVVADAINTDHLAWTNGDTGEEFGAGSHDGMGIDGLQAFLTWSPAHGAGTPPELVDVLAYIAANADALQESDGANGGSDQVIAGAGDDLVIAGGGHDVVRGGEGDDLLLGGAGSDALQGDAGDDRLRGDAGDDVLVGGAGDDLLIGGAGDDRLFGGFGNDTFAWSLGDQQTSAAPAVDSIYDFHLKDPALSDDPEADSLNLGELLADYDASSSDPGQSALDSYVIAAEDSEGNTVLHVKSGGGLSANGDNADQRVVLEGVSMGGESSAQFITQLMQDGQLSVE